MIIFLSCVVVLRGTVVLALLVFCICFLVVCIVYLHITRVQVKSPSPVQLNHKSVIFSFKSFFTFYRSDFLYLYMANVSLPLVCSVDLSFFNGKRRFVLLQAVCKSGPKYVSFIFY